METRADSVICGSLPLQTTVFQSYSVSLMAEEEGFEPPRRLITDLLVFKTNLFSLLSIPPYMVLKVRLELTRLSATVFETASSTYSNTRA